MKIRWKNEYHPMGNWVNEALGPLTYLSPEMNFRATFEGREILVVMHLVKTPAGHGEGAMQGYQPQFLDAVTLERLSEFDSEWCRELPWIEANLPEPVESTYQIWLKGQHGAPFDKELEPVRLSQLTARSFLEACDKAFGEDRNYDRTNLTYAGRKLVDHKGTWRW